MLNMLLWIGDLTITTVKIHLKLKLVLFTIVYDNGLVKIIAVILCTCSEIPFLFHFHLFLAFRGYLLFCIRKLWI